MIVAEKESRLLEALTRINEVVDAALVGCGDDSHYSDESDAGADPAVTDGKAISCTPKSIPERLQVKAAEVAYLINPVNAPALAPFGPQADGVAVMEPLRIAALTSKYWGAKSRVLTVSFMETTPADLRRRIVSHLNAWNLMGGISFAETSGVGIVRISRGGGGYYSYLGTDVLLIPKTRQTMNLEGFTMNTSDAEYKRVVRHEAGHTLAFPHEHMRRALVDRIDRKKAYAYFLRTQGWDKATVDAQVLTPLDERSLMSTPADQTSIMCYQLPGSITRDGQPITGGNDINPSDHQFCGRIYPKVGAAGSVGSGGQGDGGCRPAQASDDWDASEDVNVADAMDEVA